MTYLAAMQEVAYLVGVNPPLRIDDVAPVAQRFRRMADRAGQEIARRADWRELRRTLTLSPTPDGAQNAWPLPSDFDRLIQGNPVFTTTEFIRGSVSQDEWAGLQMLPQAGVGGLPRVFLLSGMHIFFHPAPPAGTPVTVQYITRNWIANSTTENFTTNEQTPVFPERLLILNVVWRWRRAQGAPFDDELKEFEADLAATAEANAGHRPPSQVAA